MASFAHLIQDRIVFPNGTQKCVTFSYDDGVVTDKRLIAIFDRYGLKGTFNLGTGLAGCENRPTVNGKTKIIDRLPLTDYKTVYANHEIAGHALYHSSPTHMGTAPYLYEIAQDKKNLEEIAGYLVRGFAHPFGHFDEDTKMMLKLAGYRYARAVETTGAFDLPKDFFAWEGTCHHEDKRLMDLAREFCTDGEAYNRPKTLFYIWGHSFEFELNDNWEIIEELSAYLASQKEKLWFAANIEVYDYVSAFRALEYSTDANMIYNPSALDVKLMRDGEIYTIPAGKTVQIKGEK